MQSPVQDIRVTQTNQINVAIYADQLVDCSKYLHKRFYPGIYNGHKVIHICELPISPPPPQCYSFHISILCKNSGMNCTQRQPAMISFSGLKCPPTQECHQDQAKGCSLCIVFISTCTPAFVPSQNSVWHMKGLPESLPGADPDLNPLGISKVTVSCALLLHEGLK